jgi:hypothetical protein
MKGPRLALSSLLLLFVIQSPAQQAAAPAPIRDPAAVTLLAKSLAVMTGGLPISDVTLQGTARRIAGSDDESGTAVLKALATGETRIDISFPSGSRSEVRSVSSNGPVGSWKGPDGAAHSIPQHNLLTDSSWFFPAFALGRILTSGDYSVAFLGRETRDGHFVEHLTVSRQFQATGAPPDWSPASLQRLSATDIYLDSGTLLPVAVLFNAHPDQDETTDIPTEIRFSDYRLASGPLVPFHIQKYLNNGLVLDLKLVTANLSSGLLPALFNIQ